MDDALKLNGKTFISSRRAAEISGYSMDYIGQLSRAGILDFTMVGQNRFVDLDSLAAYVDSPVSKKQNVDSEHRHVLENIKNHIEHEKAFLPQLNKKVGVVGGSVVKSGKVAYFNFSQSSLVATLLVTGFLASAVSVMSFPTDARAALQEFSQKSVNLVLMASEKFASLKVDASETVATITNLQNKSGEIFFTGIKKTKDTFIDSPALLNALTEQLAFLTGPISSALSTHLTNIENLGAGMASFYAEKPREASPKLFSTESNTSSNKFVSKLKQTKNISTVRSLSEFGTVFSNSLAGGFSLAKRHSEEGLEQNNASVLSSLAAVYGDYISFWQEAISIYMVMGVWGNNFSEVSLNYLYNLPSSLLIKSGLMAEETVEKSDEALTILSSLPRDLAKSVTASASKFRHSTTATAAYGSDALAMGINEFSLNFYNGVNDFFNIKERLKRWIAGRGGSGDVAGDNANTSPILVEEKEPEVVVDNRPIIIEGPKTIIENITERIITTSGVSGEQLTARLEELNNKLLAEIYKVSADGNTAVTNVYQTVSLTNKIDSLSSVDIDGSSYDNGTITNSTITTSSFSGTSGAFTGSVTGGSFQTAGSVTVTGNATSTFPTLSITGRLYGANGNAGANGYVLQSTGTGANWVATSTLGISGGAATFIGLSDTDQSAFTANRIIHTNSAGTGLTDTAGFIFDGTNLGLGTTSPYAKLSVVGASGVVAAKFHATSTTATSTFAGGLTTGTSGLNVLTNGRVGIGSLGPGINYGLSVTGISAVNNSAGAIKGTSPTVTTFGVLGFDDVSSNEWLGDIAGVYGRTTGSYGVVGYASAGGRGVYGLAEGGGIGVYADAESGSGYAIWSDTGTNYFNGNVGIGTTSPYARLSVTNTGTGPSFVVEDQISPDSTPFIIDASGNVGIGTTSPYSKLSVVGASGVVAAKFHATSTTATSTFAGGFSAGNNAAFVVNRAATASSLYINPGGYVGIGTAAPSRQLHVYGAGQTTAALTNAGNKGGTVYIQDSDNNSGNGGALLFGANSGFHTSIKSLLVDGNSNTIGSLAFSTRSAVGDTALTERMRIKYDGTVGIGITDPAAKLHVVGESASESTSSVIFGDNIAPVTGANRSKFIMGNTDGTSEFIIGQGATNNLLFNWIYNATPANAYGSLETYGGNNALVLQGAGGSVGIGVTTPSQALTIKSTGSVAWDNGAGTADTGLSRISAGVVGVGTGAAGSYAGTFVVTNINGGTAANDDITIQGTSNSTRTTSYVNLQPNGGNVGIGTTSPYATLSVTGTAAVTGKIVANGATLSTSVRYGIVSNSLSDIGSGAGAIKGIVAGTVFGVLGYADENAGLVNAGRVGVYGKVDSPSQSADLAIYGETVIDSGIAIKAAAGGSSATALYATASGSNGIALHASTGASGTGLTIEGSSSGYAIYSSATAKSYFAGNLGMGTTTPWRKLSVTGTVGFDGLSTAAGTPSALCLSANKEVVVNSGTATCTVSSARFKEEINYENISGLETILALKPATFFYKDTDLQRIGFIAEDVNLVDAKLTFTENDGTTLRGVRYEDMTAVLTRAIQELNSKFEDMTAGFVSGITKFKEIITDRLTTKELCLEEVCINKEQLRAILENSGQKTNPVVVPAPEPAREPAEGVTNTETTEPAANNDANAAPESESVVLPEPETAEPEPTPEPEQVEKPATDSAVTAPVDAGTGV